MGKLDNKVCLISGADNEIALGIAELFAFEGGKIIITGCNKELLERSAAAIEEKGGSCRAYTRQIDRREDVEAIFQRTVEIYGHPDVLVNCVLPEFKSVAGKSAEEILRETAISSLSSYTRLTWNAAYYMKEKAGSSIVNIAPGEGLEDISGPVGHLTSTIAGGVFSCTRRIALEYAPTDIRVNAVALGVIKTDEYRKKRELKDPDYEKKLLRHIPIQRIGCIREVAAPVLFLASDDSSYITGQILKVDGGYSIF